MFFGTKTSFEFWAVTKLVSEPGLTGLVHNSVYIKRDSFVVANMSNPYFASRAMRY